MSKINFNTILNTKANFVIHWKTITEAKSLFSKLKKEGFKWISNEELSLFNTKFEVHKKETVYFINIEKKVITFGWLYSSLLAKSATSFKGICFCENCNNCNLNNK